MEVATSSQAARNRTPNVAARHTPNRKWYTIEQHLEYRSSEKQIVREEAIRQAKLWLQTKAMDLQTPPSVMAVAGSMEQYFKNCT